MHHVWDERSSSLFFGGTNLFVKTISSVNTHQISSRFPDLHSGVEGGGITEPMSDMYVNIRSSNPVFHVVTGLNSWERYWIISDRSKYRASVSIIGHQ